MVAEAGLNLHNSNARPRVEGKKIVDLISGVERAPEDNVGGLNIPAIERVNRLDANALLAGITQGQGNGQAQSQGQSTGRVGTGDLKTSNIGGDLANQIAGGSSPSIDQILNGLNGQRQSGSRNESAAQEQGQVMEQGQNNPQVQNSPLDSRPPRGQGNELDVGALISSQGTGEGRSQGSAALGSDINSSDVAGDIANQLASNGQAYPNGQGEGRGQRGGGNAQPIQIKETIITEVNGQQIQTAIIEAGGQQAQAEASPATTSYAQAPPLAEAQPTTPPPKPEAQMPAEAQKSTPAIEMPMSTAGAESTTARAEGWNATVCIMDHSLYPH